MKRSITYLIKDLDKLIKEIIPYTGDFKKEVLILKKKEQLFKKIDDIVNKYDKMIKTLENNKNEI